MFGIENLLYDQILLLKNEYNLVAIKSEFEAEGSSYSDIVRLRRLTNKADVKLYLKIGGVEALRDIKDSVELGVDGLIAPMVETKFALKKFLEAYHAVYKENKIKLSINIESRNAISQVDDIFALAQGNIDNITLGRTDLSASYMDEEVTPDSDFVMNLVYYAGRKSADYGFSFTVGGSISSKSIAKFNDSPDIIENIECIETRKVVLPCETILGDENSLNEALRFEELYILSKKEMTDLMMESEIARLSKLSARAKETVSNVA